MDLILKEQIRNDCLIIYGYITEYIEINYGRKGNTITDYKIINEDEEMKGIIIYGKSVNAPKGKYKIQMFIPFYESNDYGYLNSMAEHFVLDHKRLKTE